MKHAVAKHGRWIGGLLIAAQDIASAACGIAWWHEDWRMVGQNPKRVAGRIHRQAERVLKV